LRGEAVQIKDSGVNGLLVRLTKPRKPTI